MLKKRDLHEVPALFELSSHPDVYPYIRHKANTSDEFYFLTKQMMEAENNGELISRTIVDEFEHPIGTINLYDIHEKSGFLATWVGQPYFGKGYNKVAKQLFLEELFFTLTIETVFMKVRKNNARSLRAVSKLPYVENANQLYPEIYYTINYPEEVYDLFVTTKEHYSSYVQFAQAGEAAEAEVVS
ncbi:GNAT family N-acetyltransferase [Pseudogracilibacillus auburnensis]|uniref:RimJ/RimL family protein N-acetyltransferase n=1 Tax=Pseudogracilibacillus auburnensis TaxID=1494959 RepID=A0A2V3W634_9BACI|nr:GNAT family N-acetyltransferase [Pseudogracilibacillus auburnensis]MBO1001490.1 GNAT family N-acetyltransferase [Pseudogracilibacillus auburnensis]PXW89592.1 RimJ/RimL family protein N-acetyltransferase [Pseudogracilibacillus auburnensis]